MAQWKFKSWHIWCIKWVRYFVCYIYIHRKNVSIVHAFTISVERTLWKNKMYIIYVQNAYFLFYAFLQNSTFLLSSCSRSGIIPDTGTSRSSIPNKENKHETKLKCSVIHLQQPQYFQDVIKGGKSMKEPLKTWSYPYRTGHCDNTDIPEIYFLIPPPTFFPWLFVEVWGSGTVLTAGGIVLKKIKQSPCSQSPYFYHRDQ